MICWLLWTSGKFLRVFEKASADELGPEWNIAGRRWLTPWARLDHARYMSHVADAGKFVQVGTV
jgi:hypothetical protein